MKANINIPDLTGNTSLTSCLKICTNRGQPLSLIYVQKYQACNLCLGNTIRAKINRLSCYCSNYVKLLLVHLLSKREMQPISTFYVVCHYPKSSSYTLSNVTQQRELFRQDYSLTEIHQLRNTNLTIKMDTPHLIISHSKGYLSHLSRVVRLSRITMICFI